MDCSGSGTPPRRSCRSTSTRAPRTPTSGCEAADFTAASPARSRCCNGAPARSGQGRQRRGAGAIGAIVMNQGNGDPGPTPTATCCSPGTLGTPVGIPAVSVSYPRVRRSPPPPGLDVRSRPTRSPRCVTPRTSSPSRGPANQQRRDGRRHLDSEPDTTGINDNGCGSAALLEVALQMRESSRRTRCGSPGGAPRRPTVGLDVLRRRLTAEEQAKIELYLNFDMIASPNYTFGVYDGDDSAPRVPAPARPARRRSRRCSRLLRLPRRAHQRGRLHRPLRLRSRSSRGVGIPAGGLFTGAEGQDRRRTSPSRAASRARSTTRATTTRATA